jgi:hypothetical protein
MAGMGPPPKPAAERRRRNRPTFGGIELDPHPRVPVPALPKWRKWRKATLEFWAELWSKPQAAQWDPSGVTLVRLAELFDAKQCKEVGLVAASAEMRQIEDRHGLSDKALMQLRWEISERCATPCDACGTASSSATGTAGAAPEAPARARRDPRLRVVKQ